MVTGLEAELKAASNRLEQLQEVLVSWKAPLHPQHYLAILAKSVSTLGKTLSPVIKP